jgi:DNA polymerase-3 subunit chi
VSKSGPEIWFYHLEHWSVERALPPLLEKTLERGWRALVRTGQPEGLEALNGHIWSYRDDGFLPHGLASEAHAQHQPILLTEAQDNANHAQVLFLIDQAELGDVSAFERCILVFDGNDQDALSAAREEWRNAKEKDLSVSYWQQTGGGGFEKKA